MMFGTFDQFFQGIQVPDQTTPGQAMSGIGDPGMSGSPTPPVSVSTPDNAKMAANMQAGGPLALSPQTRTPVGGISPTPYYTSDGMDFTKKGEFFRPLSPNDAAPTATTPLGSGPLSPQFNDVRR